MMTKFPMVSKGAGFSFELSQNISGMCDLLFNFFNFFVYEQLLNIWFCVKVPFKANLPFDGTAASFLPSATAEWLWASCVSAFSGSKILFLVLKLGECISVSLSLLAP